MLVNNGAGNSAAEVSETERVGDFSAERVPRTLEEAVLEVEDAIDNMEDEGMDYTKRVSAVQALSADFIQTSPEGMRIGDGTQCSGIGVQASDGGTVYRQQTQTGARTPEQHKARSGTYPSIYKYNDSGRTTVGTVETVGRMNGAFGWSSDKNLIVGSLASFSHNWVAKLIGYFERVRTPFQGEWNLPNMVLAETEEPEQFVPDASFAFNTRPAMTTTFSVVVESPTEATLGFDIWDNNKESVARIEETTVPAGQTRTVVRVRGFPPSNGYFNIVPRDAPKGITIKEVATQPISF